MKIRNVPLRYWFIAIFTYLFAIVTDLNHIFGTHTDLIWYICLIATLIFSYYFGLIGGLTAATFTMILHFLSMVIVYVGYGGFHLLSVLSISAVNFIFSIGIGYLADKLKKRQRELEKLNMELLEKTKALKESNERYQGLVEHSPEGIVVHGDGDIFYMNPTGKTLLGLDVCEPMIGASIFSYVHPSFHANIREYYSRNNSEKGVLDVTEQKLMHINGTEIDVEIITMPIMYDKTPAYLSLLRNISERKRMEELLRKHDKLSIIGQLAAGVAHEIRNPLTSLRGFIQLLQKGKVGNSDYFEIMLSELDRINLIVSELLYLAKPQVSEFERKNLKQLIGDVLTIIDTQAIMNNIQILLEFNLFDPFITCGEKQIKQVLINVLKNAIEAMPDGGKIRITVSTIDNHDVLIRIVDNGTGISDDRIGKLGEPFFTTKEKGTGLGLMVSFKIIETHKGHISYKSESGKGTTVDVVLPVSQQEKVKTLSFLGQ